VIEMQPIEIKKAVEERRKDRLPYLYYKEKLADLDPRDIAQRTGCPYNPHDDKVGEFSVNLMNRVYRVTYPDGIFYLEEEKVEDFKTMTMILRYFINAKGMRPTGKTIAYRDVQGGDHYYGSFEGRCLKRFAFTFSHNTAGLEKAMDKLKAEKLELGDFSYRFRFLNQIYLTVILWVADEEFPPEAQILFDENVPSAFDAEDMAVMGDIFIPILKELSKD